jgi:hypothetical protein
MDATWALVTVRVGYAQHDLQLPAEVPVAELIPLLLEALHLVTPPVAPAEVARWGLGRPNALVPLRATDTLQSAGVLDGEELVLQATEAWHSPPAVSLTQHQVGDDTAKRWVV